MYSLHNQHRRLQIYKRERVNSRRADRQTNGQRHLQKIEMLKIPGTAARSYTPGIDTHTDRQTDRD